MKSIFYFLLTLSLVQVACQQNTQLIPAQTEIVLKEKVLASAMLPKEKLGQQFQLVHQSTPSVAVPYQIADNQIFWNVTPETQEGHFELQKGIEQKETNSRIAAKEENGQWAIYIDNTKVIGYQMAITEAPEGTNPAYRRSGYIHPFNTPSGKRLTRIQPKDHYHHYGLWNPWTHTLYKGDTLDFWNLYKEQGTVRFAKMLSYQTGPLFSEYEVLHEHVVLKNNKNEVALNEIQKVRVTPLSESSYQLDFEIRYQCNTDSPFKIIEYRYGGFGWRTTEEWDNQNSRTISSEGNSRKNADGSTARWCIVDGKLGDGKGGALMMSHPDNFNHPEPLRIWPENQYDRGDLFVNFATTKNTDWVFEPSKTYILKYRLLVYDGEMNVTTANQAWDAFASPLTYNIK